jgi:hypothetical protein
MSPVRTAARRRLVNIMNRVYAGLAGFFIDVLEQAFSKFRALTQERQTASNVQVEVPFDDQERA